MLDTHALPYQTKSFEARDHSGDSFLILAPSIGPVTKCFLGHIYLTSCTRHQVSSLISIFLILVTFLRSHGVQLMLVGDVMAPMEEFNY